MRPDEKFFQGLMDMPGVQVDPAVLDTLAKRASAVSVGRGTPLEAEVIQAIQESGEQLNPEHVRRITETANTQTHLSNLDEGGGYPDFSVADPGRVWEGLNQQPAPLPESTDLDYSGPPPETYDYNDRYTDTQGLYNREADTPNGSIEPDESPKVASAFNFTKRPYLEETYKKLAHVREDYLRAVDDLQDQAYNAHLQAKLATAEFSRELRHFTVGGGDVGMAKSALLKSCDPRWAELAWNDSAKRLDYIEGVKEASGDQVCYISDPNHPLVDKFLKTAEAMKNFERARLAFEKISEGADLVHQACHNVASGENG